MSDHAPTTLEQRQIIRDFADAVRREVHVLSLHPDLLWQQLYNRLQGGGEHLHGVLAAELERRLSPQAAPWLLLRTHLSESRLLLQTLVGHDGAVITCACSPNGSTFLSGGEDGTLRLWDSRTGQPIWTLAGHAGPVLSCAYAPDGSAILSGSVDRTIKVWDAASGRERATLSGHAAPVTALAMLPEGRVAISGSTDSTIRIWDLVAGREMGLLRGHSREVTALSVEPGGRHVLSAGLDGTIKRWEVSTWQLLDEWPARSGIRAAAMASNDTFMIVCLDDVPALATCDLTMHAAERARLVTMQAQRGLGPDALRQLDYTYGHAKHATAIALTPDASRAVSGSDRALRIWDLRRKYSVLNLPGHADSITAVAVVPNGSQVLSASRDGTLRLWRLPDEADSDEPHEAANAHDANASITAVTMTPDGSRALATGRGILAIWDIAHAAAEVNLNGGESISVIPDGSRAISWEMLETFAVYVWDLQQRTELCRIPIGETRLVHRALLTPDGNRALIVVPTAEHPTSAITTVELRAPDRQGALIHTLTCDVLGGDIAGFEAIALTPDSRSMVTTLHSVHDVEHDMLGIWDLESGVYQKTLAHELEEGQSVIVLPDGRHVAAFSRTRVHPQPSAVRVWDLEAGALVQQFDTQLTRVSYASFTQGGQHVLFGSWDGKLEVWDMLAGKLLGSLSDIGSGIQTAALSPDGRRVVCGGSDRSLSVWDLQTRSRVATFYGEGLIQACAMAPDGRTLVAGDAMGVFYMLRLVAST